MLEHTRAHLRQLATYTTMAEQRAERLERRAGAAAAPKTPPAASEWRWDVVGDELRIDGRHLAVTPGDRDAVGAALHAGGKAHVPGRVRNIVTRVRRALREAGIPDAVAEAMISVREKQLRILASHPRGP